MNVKHKTVEQQNTSIKVHVCKIRPEGMDLEEILSAEWVGLTEKDELKFVAPLSINAHITRIDDEMIVKVVAQSQYELYCYRCLDASTTDWSSEFTIVIDLDTNLEFIEIDEDIRQEIIMNLPTRVLCQDNCKGLCIDCGVNLNNRECKHKHAVVTGK